MSKMYVKISLNASHKRKILDHNIQSGVRLHLLRKYIIIYLFISVALQS
jgi:hypothetical protein